MPAKREYEHWTANANESPADVLAVADALNKDDMVNGMHVCCRFEAGSWTDAVEAWREHLKQKATP